MLSDGWIVSIVLGVLLVLIIVAFVYMWHTFRRKEGPVPPKATLDSWDKLLKDIEEDRQRILSK